MLWDSAEDAADGASGDGRDPVRPMSDGGGDEMRRDSDVNSVARADVSWSDGSWEAFRKPLDWDDVKRTVFARDGQRCRVTGTSFEDAELLVVAFRNPPGEADAQDVYQPENLVTVTGSVARDAGMPVEKDSVREAMQFTNTDVVATADAVENGDTDAGSGDLQDMDVDMESVGALADEEGMVSPGMDTGTDAADAYTGFSDDDAGGLGGEADSDSDADGDSGAGASVGVPGSRGEANVDDEGRQFVVPVARREVGSDAEYAFGAYLPGMRRLVFTALAGLCVALSVTVVGTAVQAVRGAGVVGGAEMMLGLWMQAGAMAVSVLSVEAGIVLAGAWYAVHLWYREVGPSVWPEVRTVTSDSQAVRNVVVALVLAGAVSVGSMLVRVGAVGVGMPGEYAVYVLFAAFTGALAVVLNDVVVADYRRRNGPVYGFPFETLVRVGVVAAPVYAVVGASVPVSMALFGAPVVGGAGYLVVRRVRGVEADAGSGSSLPLRVRVLMRLEMMRESVSDRLKGGD